jgi:Zn finger protein HypA/HybF involved in hydrogenase expression
MWGKLESINDTDFINIVKESFYINDVILKCDYTSRLNKRTRDKIKNRIEKLNINISHFKFSHPKTLNEILIKDSPVGKKRSTGIKKRLLEEGILKEECIECGQSNIHNGKNLVLQLDHINGINDDYRIENLRILCPNCHSQTKTFAGRNIKRECKFSN